MTVRAGSSFYEYLIRPQLRKFKSDEQLIVGIRIWKMIFIHLCLAWYFSSRARVSDWCDIIELNKISFCFSRIIEYLEAFLILKPTKSSDLDKFAHEAES